MPVHVSARVVRAALLVLLPLLLTGCAFPTIPRDAPVKTTIPVPEGHCQEIAGDFLIVQSLGGGMAYGPTMRSTLRVVRWDGGLLSFDVETNVSSPPGLIVSEDRLRDVPTTEAERVLAALGVGQRIGARVISGWGADMSSAWSASCDVALRVWTVPEQDDRAGCMDAGTTTFTARTSLGERRAALYCGGGSPASEVLLTQWCEHVGHAAALAGDPWHACEPPLLGV